MLLGGVCLLLGAACGGPQWERVALDRLPGAGGDGKADALVLLNELRVDYRAGDAGKPVAEITRHVKVKILREAGARRYRRISAHYDRTFSKVIRLDARVVRPGDDKDKNESWELEDTADLRVKDGMSLYDSTRARWIRVKHLPVGSYLEYVTTTRYYRPRLWSFRQAFGGRDPVKIARLVVTAPSGWKTEHLAVEVDKTLDWKPAETRGDGKQRQVWERFDLVEIESEGWTPDAMTSVPRVHVRLESWFEDGEEVTACRNPKEVSAWLHGLSADLQKPGEAERTLVKKILAGAPDSPVEKARRLQAWVRDHIDYCSIQIGWGGWRPFAASEVLAVRYGDCKAKANLLHNLLAAAGISSRLVAIHTHGGMPRPFGLPVAFDNFNHMILDVDLPTGHVLVDATSRVAALGELPTSVQGAQYLPLSAEGHALRRARVDPAERNAEKGEFEVHLAEDASATGTFRFEWTGGWAQRLRDALIGTTEGKRKDLVRGWVELRDAEVNQTRLKRDKPPLEVASVELSGHFKRPALLQGNDDVKLLRLNALLYRWAPALPHKKRHAPVELGFRRKATVRYRFEAPPGWHFAAVPDQVEVQSTAGQFSLRWTTDGRFATATRVYVLREPNHPAAGYEDLLRFYDQAHAAQARAAVLRRGGQEDRR